MICISSHACFQILRNLCCILCCFFMLLIEVNKSLVTLKNVNMFLSKRSSYSALYTWWVQRIIDYHHLQMPMVFRKNKKFVIYHFMPIV